MCCITTTATTTAIVLFIRSREADTTINRQQEQLNNSNNTDNNSSSNDETQSPDSNTAIDYTIESNTILEETEAYSIDIEYPELANYSDTLTEGTFNDLVFYKVNSLAREIRFSEPSMMSVPNSITLSYTIEYQHERFISILITGDVYTGGAHPNPVVLTINYDLQENTELALNDLFVSGSDYLTPISNTCIYELQTLLEEDFIEAGASADADNFTHFNFNETTLKITFDAYQVGAYALGTPSVEMPLVDFSAMLKPEFK